MIILSLDSTETTATAAITEDERLIADMTVNSGLTHSETLLPMIEQLMKCARLSYDNIDMFVCSAGPGSFTGVRIGAAVLKGLAFGRNKPCIGVSALEALAYNFVGIDGLICPCMDARRSQLYNALFESRGGRITRLCEDRVISAAGLSEELREVSAPVYLCGGGYEIITEACAGNCGVVPTPQLLRYENAYSAAVCAFRNYDGSVELNSDILLSPTYLRPSQAERSKKENSLQ